MLEATTRIAMVRGRTGVKPMARLESGHNRISLTLILVANPWARLPHRVSARARMLQVNHWTDQLTAEEAFTCRCRYADRRNPARICPEYLNPTRKTMERAARTTPF